MSLKVKHNYLVATLVLLASFYGVILAIESPVQHLLEVLEDRARIPFKVSNQNVTDYRLPTSTKPLHYEVSLATNIHIEDEADPQKFMFHGEVQINILVVNTTDTIVLHSKDQTIEEAVLRYDDETGEAVPWIDNDQPTVEAVQEFLRFQTLNPLPAGRVVKLWIKYSGQLHDRAARGFYKSFYMTKDGKKSWLAATQFQSTHARHAFPCYDEPGIRATVGVTIIHHKSLHGLSNMPIKEAKPLKDYMITSFDETPAMQPYLVEITISDLDYIEVTGSGRVPQRLYGRHEALAEGLADIGLQSGVKIMEEQQRYFHTKYPLPKLDTVIHPSAGAMEHWGLVTINERNYLHDDKKDSIVDKVPKITLIAHEFAHQFFGDLVAPQWWNYLWLNEGFARYYEYRTVRDTHPELRPIDFYLFQNMQISFLVDQLEGTHALTHQVNSPDEIDGIFDEITYNKGAAFLRMLEYVIGENTFKKGLSYYLEDMAYKSATSQDLQRNLRKAIDEDRVAIGVPIEDIVYQWTTTAGFPLVTVELSDKKNPIFTQRRYLEQKSNASYVLWPIPITFYTNSQRDYFKNTHWLKDQSMEIQDNDKGLLEDPNEWIVLNFKAAGFYRINYADELWQRLSLVLESDLESIRLFNRAQLVDDVLHLAQGGYIGYDVMLSIWKYLAKEKDFVPWSSANIGLFFLLPKLTDAKSNANFMRFLREIIGPSYQRLGFIDRKYEEGVGDKYNRQFTLLFACLAGEEGCVQDATLRTQNALSDPNAVEPDLQAITFCNGLRFSNSSEFVRAYEAMIKSKDASYRAALIFGLGCATTENELKWYLNTTIDDAQDYLEDERDSALNFVIIGSGAGVRVSIEFMQENWREICNIYTRPSPIKGQVALMASYVTSDSLLESYDELLTLLVKEKLVSQAEKEAFLSISLMNVEWVRNNDAQLNEALTKHFKSSAKSLMASCLLVALSLVASLQCITSVFNRGVLYSGGPGVRRSSELYSNEG